LKRSAARDLAIQGAEAYDAGDFSTALDRFTRASALVSAPTLLVMQARSFLALGRWVEAFEAYHAAQRMPLAPDAPEPFLQAVHDAEREGSELESRLPRIEIRLPAEASGVEITVDGAPLPAALVNVTHPIDPGTHQVVATAAGQPHFSQQVQIAEREIAIVEVPAPKANLTPATQPQPTKPVVANPPAPVDREPRPNSTPSWLLPVAFSAGGAGVGIAVVSGFLAADRHDKLKKVCQGKECPPEATADLDAYHLYRGLFFVGTALGAAGLGLGTYFAIWGDKGPDEVGLELHPGGASLRGRF
jgi:hypothetical protein